MASFANDQSAYADLKSSRPFPTTDARAYQRTLPQGKCNFRDLAQGPRPPGCGCIRFWIIGNGKEQEPYCACGHHACFHELRENVKEREEASASSQDTKRSITQGDPVISPLDKGFRDAANARTLPWPSSTTKVLEMPKANDIPSFHLTSSEMRGHNFNTPIGLGLGLNLHRTLNAGRILSQSPTVADAASIAGEIPSIEADLQIPSTRQPSSEDNISPSSAFLRQIYERRLQKPQLETGIGNLPEVGVRTGEIVQSATEVATPISPTVLDAQKLIQDVADIAGTIQRGTQALTEEVRGNSVELQAIESIPHQPELARPLKDLNALLDDSVQQALRDIPATLHRLGPLLVSLQSQVTKNYDISVHESINSLIQRMNALENASFNQLPPEQVHEQFQHMDVRLLELETRTDEHGRLIAALEVESSTRGSQKQRHLVTDERTSFTSHTSARSLESTTSSALIVAAIDRMDAEGRLKIVEDRLDTLETLQLPSLAYPWEVEVVLLPWGANLRGIWLNVDDLARPGTTQDEDGLSQARSHKSAQMSSRLIEEGGWTNHTIQKWTEKDEDLLWPKACGVNGIVFHRLRSRGLVRSVNLTSAGARAISNAIHRAFGSILTTLSDQSQDSLMTGSDDNDGCLGLQEAFVPLRKIHKSSRLRFLGEPELVTPALWDAGFLASGVMMRASGGKKRLFLTTRAGYEQGNSDSWTWPKLRELPRVRNGHSQDDTAEEVAEADALEPCWAYHPMLDELPSAQTSFSSRASQSHDDHQQMAHTDAGALRGQGRDISPESSGDSGFHQPITPISEFPATQPSPSMLRSRRTASLSVSDAAGPSKNKFGSMPQIGRPLSQQSKRRIRSFEQAANPALIAALPTFVPSSSRGSTRSMRIKKRRRVERSASASSLELPTQSSGQADVQSLHPEADPEQVLLHLQDTISHGGQLMPLGQFVPRSVRGRRSSPLYEAQTVSQDTRQIVEARATEKRGVTPSAYATPYSGIVVGAGEPDDEYLPSDSGEDDEDWSGFDGERHPEGVTHEIDMHDDSSSNEDDDEDDDEVHDDDGDDDLSDAEIYDDFSEGDLGDSMSSDDDMHIG